ncbi:MAG: hypothetical protein E6R03_11575 [Hyphomicrobiaceae bacterium]|nr:MAG: hypothetical protein E6R03_11575 [Hyphomicrobiaceae bacterium]
MKHFSTEERTTDLKWLLEMIHKHGKTGLEPDLETPKVGEFLRVFTKLHAIVMVAALAQDEKLQNEFTVKVIRLLLESVCGLMITAGMNEKTDLKSFVEDATNLFHQHMTTAASEAKECLEQADEARKATPRLVGVEGADDVEIIYAKLRTEDHDSALTMGAIVVKKEQHESSEALPTSAEDGIKSAIEKLL